MNQLVIKNNGEKVMDMHWSEGERLRKVLRLVQHHSQTV